MDRDRSSHRGFATGDMREMVRGAFPPALVEALVGEVCREVEASGWDAPFSVWGVRWSDGAGGRFQPGGRISAAELSRVQQGENPLEDLLGRHLDPEWDAAILAVEGWDRSETATPAFHVPPDGQFDGPVDIPDVECRIFLYLSRSGDCYSLLLRYASRDASPTVIVDSCDIGGMLDDVFRRYVGLPVAVGGHRVVELLGRLWITQVAGRVLHDPSCTLSAALATGDPVDAMLEWTLRDVTGDAATEDVTLDGLTPMVSTLRESPEGRVLLEGLLRGLSRIDWRGSRRAALEGTFPVELDVAVVRWCDDGMFVKLVFERTLAQHVVIDGLLLAGQAALAEALLVELQERNWCEPIDRPDVGSGLLRPLQAAPCPCGRDLPYRECHGLPLFR